MATAPAPRRVFRRVGKHFIELKLTDEQMDDLWEDYLGIPPEITGKEAIEDIFQTTVALDDYLGYTLDFRHHTINTIEYNAEGDRRYPAGDRIWVTYWENHARLLAARCNVFRILVIGKVSEIFARQTSIFSEYESIFGDGEIGLILWQRRPVPSSRAEQEYDPVPTLHELTKLFFPMYVGLQDEGDAPKPGQVDDEAAGKTQLRPAK